MLTKKDIRVNGFNRFYADSGNNLDDLLSSGGLTRNSRKTSSSFPFNTRWESDNSGCKWFLFEVDDSTELSKFKALSGHEKRYWDTPYKASSHPGKTFFLTSEFYGPKNSEQEKNFCDTINFYAIKRGVAPYITPAEFDVLIDKISGGTSTAISTSAASVSSISSAPASTSVGGTSGTTPPAIGPRSFRYISEGGMKLSTDQEELLCKIEKAHCTLNEFSGIEQLLSTKDYLVVVSDRQSFTDTVKKELAAYQKYIDDLNHRRNNQNLNNQDELLLHNESPWRIKSNLGKILDRLQKTDSHSLLGLYRSFDFSYNSPVIYLFKENIDTYAEAQGVLADYVFGFVYIHEAMHAFFNSKNNEGYLSVTELEEPFAECGMLDFLNQTSSALPTDLFNAAKANVLLKQYNGPSEYGFGLAMYEISSKRGETAEIISRYREISNWLGKVGEFEYYINISTIKRLSEPDTKYEAIATICYNAMKRILDKTYSSPVHDFTVLPGLKKYIRDAGVSLKPKASVAGRPSGPFPGSRKNAWFYSGAHSEPLVQLAVSDSIDNLVYSIFKSLEIRPWVLKEVVKFLNIPTRLAGDSTKAGIWLNDSINFRDGSKRDIQGGWQLLPIGVTNLPNVQTLLKAIRLCSNNIVFSILDLGDRYILFGQRRFQRIFELKDN